MQSVTVESDGRVMSAVMAGDGDPVILLPGFLQSAQRFVDAGWVQALAEHFQVIAVDPAGYGNGSKRLELADYDPDASIVDLVELYDRIGIDQAHLVGYSQGAARACHFARQRPGLVRSLVFGGAPLFDQAAQFRELGFDVDGLFEQAMAGLKASDWAAFWAVFPNPLSDETKQLLESSNDPVSAGYLLEATRTGLPPFELPSVPTLAYWGSEDIYNETNATTGIELGIDTHVVAGGHDAAFQEVEAVMGGVIPFLSAN